MGYLPSYLPHRRRGKRGGREIPHAAEGVRGDDVRGRGENTHAQHRRLGHPANGIQSGVETPHSKRAERERAEARLRPRPGLRRGKQAPFDCAQDKLPLHADCGVGLRPARHSPLFPCPSSRTTAHEPRVAGPEGRAAHRLSFCRGGKYNPLPQGGRFRGSVLLHI